MLPVARLHTLVTVGILLVSAGSIRPLGAETLTRSPSQDTFLSAAAATTPHGNATELLLGQDPGCPTSGCNSAILVQFDLSSIPATAAVSSARLLFSRVSTNHSGDFGVQVAKHAKSWSEGGATWSSEQLLNDPVYASGSLNASAANPTLTGDGLRQIVAEWLADPGSNHGFSLIPSGSPSDYIGFASKEHGSLQPIRLEVTYSTQPLRVTVDAPDNDAAEPGNDGEFRIYRSVVSSSPLTVQFSMSGSEATPGSDFTMGSYTQATIGANKNSVALNVDVVDDGESEPDEAIELRIVAGEGYEVGNPSVATINLRDNDGGGSDIPPFNCSASSTQHCLNGGRFRVRVTWRDYQGNAGNGTAVPLTGESGLFWFFDSSNLEFLVKILDGCGYNNRFWVYAAATTDVEYTLEVADSHTGKVKKYRNQLGNRSPAITDPNAFSTCNALSADPRSPLAEHALNGEGSNAEWFASDSDAAVTGFSEEPVLWSEANANDSCSGGLILDDGSSNYGLGWVETTTLTSGAYAQKFTPPGYPFRVEKVCVRWFSSGSDVSLPYRVWILDDNGTSGRPGTRLTSVSDSYSNISGNGIWLGTSLPTPVTISSGSFFAGAEWNPSLDKKFYIFVDESTSTPRAEWYSWASTQWNDISGNWPNVRSFMIRVLGSVVSSGCSASSTALCLNQSRFKVEVSWRDYQGNIGTGKAVPFTNASGLFWFFASSNIEFLVKVLNGCSYNSRYWVYAAATTDVEYTLKVTDTQTGQYKTYTNPLGNRAPAITDSSAFSTCP